MMNIRTDVKESIVYKGSDKAKAWAIYENINTYRKTGIPVTMDIMIESGDIQIEEISKDITMYTVTVVINKKGDVNNEI